MPLYVSLTVVFWLVEDATCTGLLVDDSDWLESVGQDDIGVHCCHINVIDKRLTLNVWTVVLQGVQLIQNLFLDLIVVLSVLDFLRALDLDGKLEDIISLVD